MAVTIANQWTAVGEDQDIELVTKPTPGNWLVALVTCLVVDGSAPLLSLGDVSRNVWTLLQTDTQFANSSNGGAQLQAEVWACPAARFDGWPGLIAYITATQITANDVGTVAVDVIELAGMGNNWLTVDSITTATATAATSLSIALPAPAAAQPCVMLAAAATDNASGTVSNTGAGFTALTQASGTGPNLTMTSQWQAASTAQTAAWSSTVAANWAGIAVAIRVTGAQPAQPNPNWPITQFQVGLGANLSTPLPRVRWTDQTSRFFSLAGDHGIQAELGAAEQGTSDIVIRDDDGAYQQRPVASAASASAAGTTTTILIPDASAMNIHRTDFFTIKRTSALNSNTGFESGTTGWTPTGGTLTTTTSVVKNGNAAGQMTPDGVTATVHVDSTPNTAVAAGVVYTASGWLQCAVARSVNLNVNWFTSGGGYIATSNNVQSIAANTWVFLSASFVAPPGAAFASVIPTLTGTPPASNVLYMDDVIFRVRDNELNVMQVASTFSSGGTTTVTFTRADGTGGGALAPTAPGDVYQGIQIDLYIPFRLLMTQAGKTHQVASGWMRDLPTVYESAAWAEIEAQAGDSIETLTAASPSALGGEITRRPNLYAYWPLSDTQGTGYAQNASNVTNGSLTQVASKWGVGASASADFGAATQNVQTTTAPPVTVTSLYGDTGTGWAQAGGTAAEIATKGWALVGLDPNFPPIAGGVTVFGCLLTPDQNPILNGTIDPTVVVLKSSNPGAGTGGAVIKIAIVHAGTGFLQPSVTVWDKTTHASTTTVCGPAQITTVTWSAWALTFNQTSWAMYLNGSLAGSGSCNLVPNFTILDVGGEADQFHHSNFFNATHAHIAMWSRQLTAKEVNNLFWAMHIGGLQGEIASQRLARKIKTVGWGGTRIINSAPAYLSAEPDPGATIADLGNEIAGYEDSSLFADAAGQLQFRGRVMSYQQTPRAVLGENTAAGEIPYEAGFKPSFNPLFIYNAIETDNTRIGGVPGFIGGQGSGSLATTTFVAKDTTSDARYNTRSLTRATRYTLDSDGWHIAWWWLARYAYPQRRVETVTIEASADPTRWPFVLSVETGDIVTVMKRQINAPAPLQFRQRVLRVQPNIVFGHGGTVNGNVTLTLGAAPPPVPITGDATLGVLSGTVMGA